MAAARVPPGSPFTFVVTRSLGVVVVTAHGHLDASGAAVLSDILDDLIEGQGNLRVVVDVHDMAMVGPLGLGALVAAAASATRRGGELTVVGPSEAVVIALETAAMPRAHTASCHCSPSIVRPSTALSERPWATGNGGHSERRWPRTPAGTASPNHRRASIHHGPNC